MTHKSYRCFECGIDLSWRQVKTFEDTVLCPICEHPVSVREGAYVEIEKEEEELILPTPSQTYYCYCCVRHIPWNKVETVIRKGKIVLLRCAFCGQQPEVRETAATWLDEQWKKNNFAGKIMSFVFQPEGHFEGSCPECALEPLLFRAEIGYPLKCARCGAVFIDMLCSWCVHGRRWYMHRKEWYVDGKKVSKLDYCKIKHVTGWVPFCWDFKKKKVTEETATPVPT